MRRPARFGCTTTESLAKPVRRQPRLEPSLLASDSEPVGEISPRERLSLLGHQEGKMIARCRSKRCGKRRQDRNADRIAGLLLPHFDEARAVNLSNVLWPHANDIAATLGG